MLSPPGQLAAAELAIYIALTFPLIYILYRHGKHGILAWFFILAFALLRIIGAGLQIADEKRNSTSQTAQIISGVGLSPLIMGVLGLLSEANHYVSEKRSWVLRWPGEVVCHLVIATGLALVVVGIKKGGAVTKVGYVLFVVSWVVVIAMTALSWRLKSRGVDSRRLLTAVSLALPFLGVRILYSFISQFDKGINAYTGPIAYRVVLSALMEFIIVFILAACGNVTKNIRLEEASERKPGLEKEFRAGSV